MLHIIKRKGSFFGQQKRISARWCWFSRFFFSYSFRNLAACNNAREFARNVVAWIGCLSANFCLCFPGGGVFAPNSFNGWWVRSGNLSSLVTSTLFISSARVFSCLNACLMGVWLCEYTGRHIVRIITNEEDLTVCKGPWKGRKRAWKNEERAWGNS